MGQYLRTNGDYNIKTKDGGNIILDTGNNIGNVRVTGNLIVSGETLTVSAENLNVKDNIITLNIDESPTHAGVTKEWSGIGIERGSKADAFLVLDDRDPDVPVWTLATGVVEPVPSLDFSQANIRLRRIFIDADNPSGELTLIGNSARFGIVTVTGTENYENQVRAYGDDAIPNKAYVDQAIQDNPTFQIAKDDTRIIVLDQDDLLAEEDFLDEFGNQRYLPYTYNDLTDGVDDESRIGIFVDGQLNAEFLPNRTILHDLEIFGTTIATKDNVSNENIFLRTQGTGRIQINSVIQIDDIGLDPSTASVVSSITNGTVLYSSTPGTGDTGLYYVNPNRGNELISKRRALLFGMIF